MSSNEPRGPAQPPGSTPYLPTSHRVRAQSRLRHRLSRVASRIYSHQSATIADAHGLTRAFQARHAIPLHVRCGCCPLGCRRRPCRATAAAAAVGRHMHVVQREADAERGSGARERALRRRSRLNSRQTSNRQRNRAITCICVRAFKHSMSSRACMVSTHRE